VQRATCNGDLKGRKTRHSWVRYTFNKSAKKIDGRVFLAPMLRFAFSSASSNLFFLKLLTAIYPFDRWRKPLRVKGRQNYPARSPRLIGQKNYILANQRDGFRHFWNLFGQKKCPGALQPLKQTFAPKISLARKYRIVLTSSQWDPEDGVEQVNSIPMRSSAFLTIDSALFPNWNWMFSSQYLTSLVVFQCLI